MTDEHDYTIGHLAAQVESVASALARIEGKLDAVHEAHDRRIRGVETKLARWGGFGAAIMTLWGMLMAYLGAHR